VNAEFVARASFLPIFPRRNHLLHLTSKLFSYGTLKVTFAEEMTSNNSLQKLVRAKTGL
jgi:hypothetical protein